VADNKPAQKSRKGTGKYARYKDRVARGDTPKMRRILRNLLNGMHQPGWGLRENKKGVFKL
jgi:hypothetical protein